MTAETLRTKMLKGEVDINNTQLFFPIVIKGALYSLRQKLKIRGIEVPFYILNTGDDIMYLEVKGQDASIEPVQISNEDFVYKQIPSCTVKPGQVQIATDELTNPYARGNFEYEDGEGIYQFNAEFRRMPVKISLECDFRLDNYTDCLALVQEMISNMAFINSFRVVYMGQTINCSYTLGDSMDPGIEFNIAGDTSENKCRTLNMSLEVESSYPVFRPATVVDADIKIANFKSELTIDEENLIGETDKLVRVEPREDGWKPEDFVEQNTHPADLPYPGYKYTKE